MQYILFIFNESENHLMTTRLTPMTDDTSASKNNESKGKAATRAKNKYNAQNYDSLRVVVLKGKRNELKAYAEARGESLNGMTKRLLERETGIAL